MRTQAAAPHAILPQESARALINLAIHDSLCEALRRTTGEETDGFGLCAYYATITMLVLGQLTGRRYILQAGNVHLELSEEYQLRHPLGSTHLSMISNPAVPGGPSRARLPFPEFHAWVGSIHLTPEEQNIYPDHSSRRPAYEVIDLSSRHYQRQVRTLDPAWVEPEDFATNPLWTTADQLPSWLLLEPVEETTRDVAAMMSEPERCRIVIQATRSALAQLKGLDLLQAGLQPSSLAA